MDTTDRAATDAADRIARETLAIACADAGLPVDVDDLCADAVLIADGIRRVSPRLLRVPLLRALSVDPRDIAAAIEELEELLDDSPHGDWGEDEDQDPPVRAARLQITSLRLIGTIAALLFVAIALRPGITSSLHNAIVEQPAAVGSPSVEEATSKLLTNVGAGLPFEGGSRRLPPATILVDSEEQYRRHTTRLRRWMELQGIEITTLGKCPKGQDWAGRYDAREKRILICPRMDALSELRLSIHESAHFLQNRDGFRGEEPEAEAVAYVALTALGFDTADSTMVMRAKGKYRPDFKKLSEGRAAVERMATEILNGIRDSP